jgi:hypothetical protein
MMTDTIAPETPTGTRPKTRFEQISERLVTLKTERSEICRNGATIRRGAIAYATHPPEGYGFREPTQENRRLDALNARLEAIEAEEAALEQERTSRVVLEAHRDQLLADLAAAGRALPPRALRTPRDVDPVRALQIRTQQWCARYDCWPPEES